MYPTAPHGGNDYPDGHVFKFLGELNRISHRRERCVLQIVYRSGHRPDVAFALIDDSVRFGQHFLRIEAKQMIVFKIFECFEVRFPGVIFFVILSVGRIRFYHRFRIGKFIHGIGHIRLPRSVIDLSDQHVFEAFFGAARAHRERFSRRVRPHPVEFYQKSSVFVSGTRFELSVKGHADLAPRFRLAVNFHFFLALQHHIVRKDTAHINFFGRRRAFYGQGCRPRA